MFSTTKQDQVVYQGPVRSEEEVKKDLDSIGPEIVQTLSVSTYWIKNWISYWLAIFWMLHVASKASQVSIWDISVDEVTICKIAKVTWGFCLCFKVRNNGPSDLRSSEVVVNFPKAYSSSKPDSFLLYLLLVEVPNSLFSLLYWVLVQCCGYHMPCRRAEFQFLLERYNWLAFRDWENEDQHAGKGSVPSPTSPTSCHWMLTQGN